MVKWRAVSRVRVAIMFKFLKKKSDQSPPATDKTDSDYTAMTPADVAPPEKESFFGRLKKGLSKTRHSLSSKVAQLFLGKKTLDADLFHQIETLLISADIGVATTEKIMQQLTEGLARKELTDTDAVFQALKNALTAILIPCAKPLTWPATTKPFVILVVGINGSGKTTTIGKLAHFYKSQGKNIMLAAGDTFRAAAVEQLKIWSERNKIPLIHQAPGADAAAVIYDAFSASIARHVDLLIADTAGRLHTQTNLMAELKKIKRVMGKLDSTAPHEVLIVLDASLGQNVMNQVKQFHEDLGVTGIALTKLDGTAKGGIIFAIADELKIPIRFIGVGEGIDDLRPFVAEDFVEALFAD